jgi:catalase-peroxidase
MKDHAATQGTCPFRGTRIGGALGSEPQLDHWWPNRLKVELLHQDPPFANPLCDQDYAEAFSKLDLDAVKADIKKFLTTSVDWWPSDYHNYGPQMVRMAWHSAGTYRIADGRGGAAQAMQRFAPINSWWDNGNTDKSRRLLAPIKQKYGASISWADLIVLTGNCALEIMNFPTFGFGGGRIDAWEADKATYWGPEGWNGKRVNEVPAGPLEGHPNQMVTRDIRWEGDVKEDYYDLENPLAATNQALIYVDPEGPNGNGVPMDSARDIRETFARMAMNDEETVALIAGGHAFGKSHGMTSPDEVGPAPEGAPMKAMGLGWQNPKGTGFGQYTMTNGIEGSWTPNPTMWDNDYLTNLFKFEWKQTKSPAGATQWIPVDPDAPKTPDAHVPGQMNDLMMMTSDIALKVDPAYRDVCLKFLNDFDAFTEAFSKAWYKLVHRDMGPKVRYLGKEVPAEEFLWQDPIPRNDGYALSDTNVATLKDKIAATGLSVQELVSTAFASAATYRKSDNRGGANGARIRLEPQRSWPVNNPPRLVRVLDVLQGVKADFGNVSMADLIVLAGCAGVEKAARDAGVPVDVPFVGGRMDTTAELTDEEQVNWLQPVVDGFRNYRNDAVGYHVAPEHLFLDKANLLSLTVPEWTALTGGLKVLAGDYDSDGAAVFTDRPGVLTNDFFKVLTSMEFEWKAQGEDEMGFDLIRRSGGQNAYTATRCDLVFGANAQLRQVAEVYAADDGHTRLVKDFVKVWHKVMMLDRFDVPAEREAAVAVCKSA